MARLLALEWNDTESRLAVASLRGGQVVVEQAFTVPLTGRGEDGKGESDAAAQIAAAITLRGLSRSDTLVAVGRSSIELRLLSLPPAPDEELPDLVRFQAQREFNALEESWPLDFIPFAAPADQPRNVLAAAIDAELVTKIQEACQASGLKVRRMVMRPCAAAALRCRSQGDEPSQVQLLADLLLDEADLTVIVGRQPVFLRTVRLPGDPLECEEAAQSLQAEVRRTMVASLNQLGGRRVETLVLCGSDRKHAALAESLAQQISLPCELFDPFEGLRREGELKDHLPDHPGRFAPLLGALVDELRETVPAIDFLHPRRRPAPPSRRKTYLQVGVAVAAVVLAVLVWAWISYQGLSDEIDRLQAQSKEWDRKLEKAAKLDRTASTIDQWTVPNVVWLDQLRWLSEELPPAREAMITQAQFSGVTKNGEIALEGLADSVETVERIDNRLRDKTHQVLGKGKSGDTSKNPYTLRFNSTVTIQAEKR